LWWLAKDLANGWLAVVQWLMLTEPGSSLTGVSGQTASAWPGYINDCTASWPANLAKESQPGQYDVAADVAAKCSLALLLGLALPCNLAHLLPLCPLACSIAVPLLPSYACLMPVLL